MSKIDKRKANIQFYQQHVKGWWGKEERVVRRLLGLYKTNLYLHIWGESFLRWGPPSVVFSSFQFEYVLYMYCTVHVLYCTLYCTVHVCTCTAKASVFLPLRWPTGSLPYVRRQPKQQYPPSVTYIPGGPPPSSTLRYALVFPGPGILHV